jgi:peptidyl-dipeptidase A
MDGAVPRLLLLPLLSAVLTGCSGDKAAGPTQPTPDEFLARWTTVAQPLWAAWQEAEWKAHLNVRDSDASFAEAAEEAKAAWEAEVGKPAWLTEARDVLSAAQDRARKEEADAEGPRKARPDELAAVEAVRLTARGANESGKEIRTRLDRELGLLLRTRDRSLPKLDGAPAPTDEVEGRYRAATDSAARAALWSATLSVARDLKPAFGVVRDLRNQAAQKAGFDNHHALVVTPSGSKPGDLQIQLAKAETAVRPLYRQLHTWVRYELAARYGAAEVPERLPAHWLDDPMGATWAGTFRLAGTDPQANLAMLGPQKMLEQAESFFTGIGLNTLPPEVWGRSSLYPADPSGRYQKTPGASTWDLDLQGDVRMLMSVTANEAWLHAAHRELAYAHVLLERGAAKIPAPLRTNPPWVLPTALATWSDFAASKPARLATLGLLDPSGLPPDDLLLLDEALLWLPYIPFAAGTAASFERELYAESLAVDRMTGRWWELAAEHQGVAPPETRTERWADPLYLQSLIESPGRSYELALAVMLAFQIHEKVCQDAGLDPRKADVSMMQGGSALFKKLAVRADVIDWNKAVEEVLGAPPSADAMVRYFAPLDAWLNERNDGRTVTLPKL